MDDQTLSQFASPAKKHKPMSSIEHQQQGFRTPRAVRSALLQCTPGPRTPGAGPASAGSQSCLSTPSPTAHPKHGQQQQQLSQQLFGLREFLGAVYASMPLLKSRGLAATFGNLQQPVQSLAGKTFKVYHLRQIKALYPAAFDWQHIRMTVDGQKDQQQLLLSMPSLPHSSSSPGAGKRGSAAQSKDFAERLDRFLEAHQGKDHSSVELPLADLPPPCPMPTGSASKTPATSQARSTTPGRAAGASLPPDTPQAGVFKSALMSPATATPQPAAERVTARGSSFFSPDSRPPRLSAAAATAPAARRTGNLFGTPVGTAAKPLAAGCHTGGPTKIRKLSFEGAQKKPGGPADDGVPSKQQAAAAQEGKAGCTMTPLKRPQSSGLKFELPAAMMTKLQAGSALASSPVVKQERATQDHAHALSLVPKSFDVVRAIFGDQGPVAKPMEEVVRLLRQRGTFASGLSLEEARHQIELLMRLVPQWIKRKHASGGYLLDLKPQLCISRGVRATDVRRQLLDAVRAAERGPEAQQGRGQGVLGSGDDEGQAPKQLGGHAAGMGQQGAGDNGTPSKGGQRPLPPLVTSGSPFSSKVGRPSYAGASSAAVAAAAVGDGLPADVLQLLQ